MTTPNRRTSWKRFWLAPALAAALLAGCATETPTALPGEGDGLGTAAAPTTALNSPEPLATEPVSSGESTAVGTAVDDDGAVSTPEAGQTTVAEATNAQVTSEPAATSAVNTPEPAATMPPQGTAGAGAEGTPAAQGTAEPDTALVQSSDLIGMDVMGADGDVIGTIEDLLVNENGGIEFAVLRVPEGTDELLRAIDWDSLTANLEEEQLMLGDLSLLDSAPEFDLSGLQPDSLIINTQGTDLPDEFNNLLRASQLADLPLSTQGQVALGQLQDLLVDVRAGEVDFAVLDLSSLLGQAAATTDVAVPWGQISVNTEAAADAARALQLNVDADTLLNAPTINLDDLPTWFDPNTATWDEDLVDFWNNLG